MRILLYSSVRLFGESLGACLSREASVAEVAVEAEPLDLVRRIRSFQADVVLFDVARRTELSTVRVIADSWPQLPVVALAVPEASTEVIACADAGVVSYVPRDASIEQLLTIVRMAMRREMECDPKIACSLLQEIRKRRGPLVRGEVGGDLTSREGEILGLLSRGLSNKEIAVELHLSVATVKNHVHAVLRKLQLKRRTEARQLLSEKPWLLRSA